MPDVEPTRCKKEPRFMKRQGFSLAAIVLALILIVLAYALTQVSVSALPEPGVLETAVATRARDWLIARSARAVPYPSVRASPVEIARGKALYGMDCASCHGEDARMPTPIGKSMYPRAPDLGSRLVQHLTDRQLFWVVKNGVRLSGMPGFGNIDTDEEIWQLTYYVRSVGKPLRR
jgi:mono/diheme cytochrome c family protein